ncbi:putative T7SS-secreted protein [Streptomyces sp. SAS_269]|uniref:putative T7SS-secreted protein n=1 Tax=Streptomyces sp. SAS_269 TaxID=3412749 RepID=UPI00403C461B
MAETQRENLRESTLERLDAAARKGKHGGRPPVINIPRTAPIKLWERALARSPNTSLCSSSEPALAAGCGTGAGGLSVERSARAALSVAHTRRPAGGAMAKALCTCGAAVTTAMGRARFRLRASRMRRAANADHVSRRDEGPGPKPEPDHNAGRADANAAVDKLREARKQRNTAASEAQGKVKAALAHAPAGAPSAGTPAQRLHGRLPGRQHRTHARHGRHSHGRRGPAQLHPWPQPHGVL